MLQIHRTGQFLAFIGLALSLSLPAFAELESAEGWQRAHQLRWDGETVRAAEGEGEPGIWLSEEQAEPLLSSASLGDQTLSFDIWLAPGARAGLYLQGRYEVMLAPEQEEDGDELERMGALAPRWDEEREPPAYDGVAPSARAAEPGGQWQRVAIRFRAPRYDEAGQKTDSALLVEVKVNGETVQRNTLVTGFTREAIDPWEAPTGPLMLRVHRGPVALRDLSLARADFGALTLPEENGGETNEDELQDFVELGAETFRQTGCASCHAVKAGEASVRAGPNLHGLFQREPRDRRVREGEADNEFTLKADRSYLHSSVRAPDAELAIAESGDKAGEPFKPLMPAYGEDALSDKQIDAIGAYLKTLNPLPDQGPVVQLVEEKGPQTYDPLTDGLQKLVLDRVRIQRGPMQDTSGRAIHVGLPNGVNYTFDPRVLGIVKLWQGGFLDMSGELRNRGGGGLAMGYESREVDLGEATVLVAPLQPDGQPVDFSFKESVYGDFETIEENLHADTDFDQMMAAVDAGFRGYRRDSRRKEAVPAFDLRVGENEFSLALAIDADGELTLTLRGDLAQAQNLRLADGLLEGVEVSAGRIRDGQWQLPAGVETPVRLSARLALSSDPWRPPESDFDYESQPLKVVESEAKLPAGYRIEDYLPPKDNFGRDLLFEPLGIDVAPDGTVVVVTRNAGIWRLVDGQWQLFAEGFFDSLGVVVEDRKGLDLVIGQKAELTRVRDTNGDGRADRFETLFDDFGFHWNYHTYLHGPVKGEDGAYYLGLNLAHADQAIYKADGLYMGSQGGYSGWAFRVTPDGEASPWASGLRSAAGWARGPEDRLWITENQGEFVGTSKLFRLRQGVFYGHPSGLVDRPGMTPDSPEIAWEQVADERPRELLLMPQNQLANSPGHPVWDETEGDFGPFAGQMFIGDQTQSNLFRVALETLPDGTEQGAAMPFAADLASGAMRPVFLPDNSLLLGQTGRGWQAKGGHIAALQRIVWDGERAPLAIERMTVTPDGFRVHFTRPLPDSLDEKALADKLSLDSWTYRDAPDYGSPQLAERSEALSDLSLGESRRVLTLTLADTDIPRAHPQQTGRVYHLVFEHEELTAGHGGVPMSAFYTLHRFPAAE